MRYNGKYAGSIAETNVCTGEKRHPCPRDARFCPECGAETAFFRKGYLLSWKKCCQSGVDEKTGMTIEEWQRLFSQ